MNPTFNQYRKLPGLRMPDLRRTLGGWLVGIAGGFVADHQQESWSQEFLDHGNLRSADDGPGAGIRR